jgi:hypothetical protein
MRYFELTYMRMFFFCSRTYIERGHHVETGLTGLIIGVDETGMQKLWNTFQAIGNIAFAYAFSMVIAEIQASNVRQNYMRLMQFIIMLIYTSLDCF